MPIQSGANTLGSSPASLSNNTNFYKYEPFRFIFTGGSNFAVSGSLVSYCATSSSNAVFASTTGFQATGSPLGETLTITSLPNNSVSYTFFINAGRFQISPTTTSLVAYLSEPISYTFTSSVSLVAAFPTPSLPPGLAFTYSSPTTWILSGTPTLKSPSSNYLFIGSNTSNTVSTSLPIQVFGERLVMTPATSSGNILTIGTPITPITFTIANYPLTASVASFVSSNLPLGLTLTTNSSNLPGANATIAGTPLNANFTSNSSSNASMTITAKATGVTALTSISTVAFTYAPVIVFTAPSITVSSFYLNVPGTLTVSANTLFPYAVVSNFSATGLPAGFSINATTGIISGTPTVLTPTNSTVITATRSGITKQQTLNLTVLSNTATVTSNLTTPQSFVVGRTITPILFTFSNAAGTLLNTVTSNVIPGITGTVSGSVVTLSGTPVVASSGTLTVTATTTDGASVTGSIGYVTTLDTWAYSSTPVSPFTFRQNSEITPIQFFATPASNSAQIVYFTNTAAIPPGLYVTPAGVLKGTPTVVVTNASLNGITGTNGYVSVAPSGFTYTVLADGVLATSANESNALTLGAPVGPITIATQTLAGFVPTGTITFPNYTYGITATATSIAGTLGNGVYPDVIMPSVTVLAGTLAGYGLPVVFRLVATNPQTITRYTIRASATSYTVCRDDGAFNYSNIPGASRATNRPLDFQWSSPTSSTDNTLVIADGTSNVLLSKNFGTFGLSAPATTNILQCSYSSVLSSWLALGKGTSLSLYKSSNADIVAGWRAANELVTVIDARTNDSSYILRVTSVPGAPTQTRVFIGGRSLYVYDDTGGVFTGTSFPTLPFTSVGTTLVDIYAIVLAPKLVVGGGAAPSGATIQYSTNNGTTWANASNSFTTRTTEIVTGGSNASLGWLAVGLNGTTPGVSYSSDAITWSNVPLTALSGGALGPIQFDGTYWCIFDGLSMYRHDALSSSITTASAWTKTAITFAGSSPSDVLYTFPTPVYAGGPPVPTLYIGVTPNGPVFTSPTTTTYLIYQYVKINTITFAATSTTGVAPVYFLDSTLPAGMTWDPVLATITGLSVQLGTFIVDVYAQSSIGVSKKSITFVVSQVVVTRNTPTAAAYTAFQREKVIADAATATINDHAVPFEVGPFLLNRPPNKVEAPELCCDGK